MTLGEKLQRLRKQRGWSQEALAEKMAVTRQTVSKWELDQSVPELNCITRFSDLFGVSVDYLIRDSAQEPGAVSPQKKKFSFPPKFRQTARIVLSVSGWAGGCVCLICDYFTAGKLSWSLIVAESIAAGWLVTLPALTAKKNIVRKTLAAASAVTVPFLAILSRLLDRPMVFRLGSCIALASIAAVWAVYGIFRKCGQRIWRALGFSLWVMIPLPVLILLLIMHFLPDAACDLSSSAFNSAITAALSLACFGMDHLQKKRKKT